MVAPARSLADLISEIRQRSDHQNSNFVDDTELESWISQSAAAVMDLVLDYAGTDAFVAETTFSTVGGALGDRYDLPAEFYRLIGVDVQFHGRWRPIRPFAAHERNRFEGTSGWTGPQDVRFALWGRNLGASLGDQSLKFIPAPPAGMSVRVLYVPLALPVTSLSNHVSVNGWDEYIVADVCAKIVEKKEGDQRPFITRRDAAAVRIIAAAQQLDQSFPRQMRDVSEEYVDHELDALRWS